MTCGNVNSLLDCPNKDDLLGFYRASLDVDRMDAIQNHLESCASCILFFDSHDERSDTIVHALTSQSATADDEIEFQKLQSQLLSEPELVETEVWIDHPPAGRPFRDPRDRVGESIGEYKLLEVIGCGANGAVYKAIHKRLDRFFALKILDPTHDSDENSVDRFLVEMKAVGRLDHPNIVRATDAGNEDGQYFLAMEYVDGIDVSRLVRKHGPLSIANACEVIRQAAVGLDVAHANGMVHRDVKPSNLFLDNSGSVKILDLGLVSLSETLDFDSPSIVARGTADYMSPEQWENYRSVDAQADIYSLGCAFFKLLTGDAPFAEVPVGYTGKMQAHQFAPIPSLRQFRTDVPLGLERFVRKMMSKKKEHRPNSMVEVASTLRLYTDEHKLKSLIGECNSEGDSNQVVVRASSRNLSTRRRLLVAAGIGGASLVSYQLFGAKSPAKPKIQDWRPLVPSNEHELVTLDPNANFIVDRQNVVSFFAEDATLLPLGAPIHGRYQIETHIDELPADSAAGVAFQYRKTKQTVGTLHPFLSIQVMCDARGAYQLQWKKYQWSLRKIDSSIEEVILSKVSLQRFDVRSIRLCVELGNHQLPVVLVNDTVIDANNWSNSKQIQEIRQITKSKLAEEYLGTLGLFANGHGTRFRQTQLKYII